MRALHVAFYRNMNVGHARSPTRSQLEGAFRAAGADSVRSFQTNGTVVFSAGGDQPDALVSWAAPLLAEQSGYAEAVFVRRLDALSAALARQPFPAVRDERTYRETFTFYDGGKAPELDLPWTCPRGDINVLEVHEDYALSVVRKTGTTAGSPTAVMELLLGLPATTRTLGTIERLVKACG